VKKLHYLLCCRRT